MNAATQLPGPLWRVIGASSRPEVVALFAWMLLFGAGVVFVARAEIPGEDSYSVRAWKADDGLPENRVVGVIQTPDGYLWVATQNGLVRFDGVRFQRVDLAGTPGLIAGTMRALVLDRAGRVWLAKEEGGNLFCFEGSQVSRVTPEQGLPKDDAQRSMAVDGEGNVWISYSSGRVARYQPGNQAEVFTTANGIPGGGWTCWLVTDRNGTLWFAKGSQVGVFRHGRFTVLENFGSAALRIAAARAGGIWVCAGQRILKFEEGTETVGLAQILPSDLRDGPGFEPSVLLEDREGAVWVGTTSSGLFRCDSNSVMRVEVSNPAILSLVEDREANVWVGTRGGGLNRVRLRMASMINSSAGLPFEGVQSVSLDTSNRLWVVSDNGLVARGRGTTWVIQSLTDHATAPYATCVVGATNGQVWIGARAGLLFRWEDGSFQDLGLRDALSNRSLRSLMVAGNGDMWIATDSPEFIYRLRGGDLKSFALAPGRRFVRALAEDAAGNIWAGASDGLLVRVTDDHLTDETGKSEALSIRCLHATPKGDLWIGYAGAGAGRLREGRITRFTTEQGLLNDYVSQIQTDDGGSVWFAGNQGVFQVREKDFDDVTQGVSTRVWPVAYGRSEGMPGLQASFDFCPSSLCAPDTRLYFSMLSGLAEVRLDKARLNYRPPNVFIERVTGDERTYAAYHVVTTLASSNGTALMELRNHSQSKELRLPPGLQQVEIEFTALSFVAPENVQFRYQLEGLDASWVDAGTRRVASYTHPPPGTYRFNVTACNNDGIWNKIGDTLVVTFEPFFWETIWFKVLASGIVFGAGCGLVVLVIRRRHRRVVEQLEHQRALELERTRIARDLHDDLGVGLTEIGLLGDLASAGGPEATGSREQVQEITNRARMLAASLDEIVWAINPTNDTSQSLVDYIFPYAQKLLARAGIRCRLEVVEPLPTGNLSAEDRHEFFHAYKEALNNIIRHSGASRVEIKLTATAGQLMIRVSDDGRGLGGAVAKEARHGMAGMRDRLMRLGGRCEFADREGGGTTVTFILPVKSK